jgi:trans-aconitate 2-methyltransferase
LTAQLAARCREVVGVDASAAMIDQAAKNFPTLRFEVADARALPYREEFDAVFSNAVLHWVKPPEQAVQSVERALKPGGRFVAEFGGKGNVQLIANALAQAAADLGMAPQPSPWYFPGIAEYASLLEATGLDVTYAVLFDRPTPLEGSDGMRNWIRMFAGQMLPNERQDDFLERVAHLLQPTLCRDGRWFADYRRLRLIARK